MKAHAISVDQECSANWVGSHILVQIHDAKFNLDTAEKQAFLMFYSQILPEKLWKSHKC